MPTLRAVHDRLAVWDEANARVRRPVEAVVWNEVRPGAQEPRMKERLPAVPVIDLAEQRLAHGRAAEHGLHVEVVPFGPVDVEDDGLEAERLGHRAGDRVEDGADVGTAAHRAADLEQALQGGAELSLGDGYIAGAL